MKDTFVFELLSCWLFVYTVLILTRCSPVSGLYFWDTQLYIILSTSRLSTYRINNATVKPITWLRPQINSSHSSGISHGWLNWFSTVKWSSNKQAFPTWKGSDSHQTWTLCRWQCCRRQTLFLTTVAGWLLLLERYRSPVLHSYRLLHKNGRRVKQNRQWVICAVH